MTFRHPAVGFTLPLPATWERAEDPRPDVALIAIEPEHAGPFRANVVVTVQALPAALDVDGWQADADELLGRALHGYLPLDHERQRVDGRVVVRRLAHHAREESGSITMEQWAFVHDGRGFTLTASAGTLEYDALADTFAAIAAEFRP